jgi:predicted transcriptional regulator
MDDVRPAEVMEFAKDLAIAWLGNPNTRADSDDVAGFLKAIHETFASMPQVGLDARPSAPSQAGGVVKFSPAVDFPPAVDPGESLASKDFIISLIDGKPYKALRRHLARHGLSPEDYRRKFGLRPDYPMVAENYSRARRELANRTWVDRKVEQDTKGRGQGAKAEKTSRKRSVSAPR